MAAMRTYRQERDEWKSGYEDLKGRTDGLMDAWEGRIKALEASISEERAGWKREVRKARAPGFGIFAGYGFDSSGDGNFVIGAGLVWKVF